jgi:prepilin peptidase CpaA
MHFILNHWPLWFICVAMILAAVIDGWKLKVPNWLTFPLVLSGWALGLCHTFGWLAGTGDGGIGASLAATAIGFVLLFPVYAIGGMGAGDVKLMAGVGAWIGPACTFSAFLATALVGGAMGLAMMVASGELARHLALTRAIGREVLTVRDPSALSELAARRKPTMMLLPYGIPIAVGTISYLWVVASW